MEDHIIPIEAGADEARHKAGQRNIISSKKVMRRLDVRSRATLWNRVKAGTLPPPVEVGGQQIGWYEDEIDAKINGLPRVNYAPKAAAEGPVR